LSKCANAAIVESAKLSFISISKRRASLECYFQSALNGNLLLFISPLKFTKNYELLRLF
jgi:hypothetical protein